MSAKHLVSQACDPSAGTARWREADVWADLRRGQGVSEGVPGELSQLPILPPCLSVCACPFAQENILRDTVTYTGAQPHLFFYPFATMLSLRSSAW
jgi:hypothetical protein